MNLWKKEAALLFYRHPSTLQFCLFVCLFVFVASRCRAHAD